MSRLTAKGFAEGLGVLGVIGSLIFVGLEVRQNSAATRASSNGTAAALFIELNLVIASSPDLARAMVEVGTDPEGASASDRILVLGLWRSIFNAWSNVHRQWANGTIDSVLYKGVVNEISSYSTKAKIGGPADQFERRARTMRWAWTSEQFVYDSEFVDFVESILATGSPPE